MIISASRRTDIPALYPVWFMNRLRAGEVLVPNPYNRKKVNRIRLSPDTVGLQRGDRTGDPVYGGRNGNLPFVE